MNLPISDELLQFHRYLSDKLQAGRNNLSPEEAVDEWRQQHPDQQAFEEDILAIQEALDDVARGETGMDFAEFDAEFRKEHRLP